MIRTPDVDHPVEVSALEFIDVIEDVGREVGRIPVPPDQDVILVGVGFEPGGALLFDNPPQRLEPL